MATDPDRSKEGAWSELERGFFASAPPDVPGPAPEPMRFDDLDPTEPAPRIWRAHLSRAWAATAGARRALRSRAAAVAAARLAAVLRSGSHDRRIVAVAAAALIVVTSVSAGVVASRGGGRTMPRNAPRLGAVAVARPVVSQAEIAAPALMTVAEPEAPRPAEAAGPEPMPPPQQRRTHAKPATRHSAQTKAAGKHAPRSVARH